MPNDAIEHVNNLGLWQGMPKTLTFLDCFGLGLPDADDAVDDDHDSNYEPDDNSSSNADSYYSDSDNSGYNSNSYISDDGDSDSDNDCPADASFRRHRHIARGPDRHDPNDNARITGVRCPQADENPIKVEQDESVPDLVANDDDASDSSDSKDDDSVDDMEPKHDNDEDEDLAKITEVGVSSTGVDGDDKDSDVNEETQDSHIDNEARKTAAMSTTTMTILLS